MKEEEEKKETGIQKNTPKKVVKKIDPKQAEEQESLLFKADQLSPASKIVNKDEVVQLRSGIPMNLSAYVRDHFVEHSVHFFKPFFYALADMYGLDRSVMDQYVKPLIVPRIINRYVYGRFPNKVLARIRQKNPMLDDFSRGQKHFQYLTEYADGLLRGYIKDAIRVMEASKSYKEFREKFVSEFGVSNQTELFD